MLMCRGGESALIGRYMRRELRFFSDFRWKGLTVMKRKHKYITRNILAFVLMLSMVFGLIQCMPMVVKAATTKTVDYIDAYGNLQTTEATVLTGNEAHNGAWSMIPLGVEGTTTYYIAEGTLSYSAGFLLQGDVVLILGDNANLTINGQGLCVIYGI